MTLTCQEDLDSLIRLINSTASNYSGFSVRLFSEPASISSADGMFIKTPSIESEPDPLLMVGLLPWSRLQRGIHRMTVIQ